MKNFKNLFVVFLSLMAFSSLRAMPPMFVEGEPEEKSPKQVESGHPGDRSRDATADSSSALARNTSGMGGAVDLSSSSAAPQNQAPSSFASESWADMDDWANMQDDLFDGTSSVYTVPQAAIVPNLNQQIQSIIGKMPASGMKGCVTKQVYQAARKAGLDYYQAGNIGYTWHAVQEANAENPPVPHEEIEALLRNPNIRVFSETNKTFAIQDINNPGSLIVRIIKSDLNDSVIKLETVFRPDGYRQKALDYVREAQGILRTKDSDLDLETPWNDIQQMTTVVTSQRETVPMNFAIRNRLRKDLVEQHAGIITQLAAADQAKFWQLLRGEGKLKGAFSLCNEADREETAD